LVAGALALLLLVGGHWAVLQSLAWARMVVVYSQHDSLSTALRKTFDGRHPCALCLRIRYGQQEEQQKSGQAPREKPGKMPELLCDAPSIGVPLAPSTCVEAPSVPLDRYADFVEAPPTPPPRADVAVL
jgi:hypothetical protein